LGHWDLRPSQYWSDDDSDLGFEQLTLLLLLCAGLGGGALGGGLFFGFLRHDEGG